MGLVTPGHALVPLGPPLVVLHPSQLSGRADGAPACTPGMHSTPTACDSAATTRDGSRKGGVETEAAAGVGAPLEAVVRQGSSAEKPTLLAGPAAIPGIPRFGGEQATVGDGCGGAVAAGRACGARGDPCGRLSADAEGERECGGRGDAVAAARLLRLASGEQQVRPPRALGMPFA